MQNQDASGNQAALLQRLAAVLKQADPDLQIFETHISFILVSKNLAYKFKKAVRFEFLDFSTLESRHFYCMEEFRLNRRLAPELYLDVVAVTGSTLLPLLDAPGVAIDYAVKMRAFPQEALWSHRIKTACLDRQEIAALAVRLAEFHRTATIASAQDEWGAAAGLRSVAEENVRDLAGLAQDLQQQRLIREIEAWQEAELAKLENAFRQRKASGLVRECHGDLHAGNILTLDGQVAIFDCIEFSESLRWIDVMNDSGFIYMDLQSQGLPAFATRFLNQYLQLTGDFDGLQVLRYYEVERALVRAKVALLRAQQWQDDAPERASCQQEAAKYLGFSARAIQPQASAIIITHGFSGSGKSSIAQRMVELLGALQIRSDVERKRMKLSENAVLTPAPSGIGAYDAVTTTQTYERLLRLVRQIVEAGLPVIVDAAFLQREQRLPFAALARELGVPFFVLDVQAQESTMKARIARRVGLGKDPSDADVAVLMRQIAGHEPLSEAETQGVVVVNNDAEIGPERLDELAAPVLNAMQDWSARASQASGTPTPGNTE